MTVDRIDTIFRESQDLQSLLAENNEISLSIATDAHLRKVLLLASASYYEKRITTGMQSWCRAFSDERLSSFLSKRVLDRSYHTLFNWNQNNCNQFLKYFGEDFFEEFKNLISADTELQYSIDAFLEIGRERNRLVHQNLGIYSLEKTVSEIYQLHKDAKVFVVILFQQLAVKKLHHSV